MIPSNIRLFSWVDVEDVLMAHDWPAWLVWARAYWDGLTLGIRPGLRETAVRELKTLFEPRYEDDSRSDVAGRIVLESRPGHRRTLEVLLTEETSVVPALPRRIPSLARPSVLRAPVAQGEPPEPLPDALPPLVGLHSFKGGVGRTVHALALCLSLREAGAKVLLVDADLEAPGISWLLRSRLPEPPVALSDFLALVHGDPEPAAQDAILLAADRLQDAQVDGVVVLPAFRSDTQFAALEVRPEHVIKGAADPFLLTRVLAELGGAVGADVVIVDLRAGLSELASGLLLDPRVYRVLVTTLSGQSLLGTQQVLTLIRERAPSMRSEDPLPAVIMSQLTPEQDQGETIVNEEAAIRRAFGQASPSEAPLADEASMRVIQTPFVPTLLGLPSSWERTLERIQTAGLPEAMEPVRAWLPLRTARSEAEQALNLRDARTTLAQIAERLVFAERGGSPDFLPTVPLRRLASDHRRHLPSCVIVGAKGAGKTFTFLQVIQRDGWQAFVRDAGAVSNGGTDGQSAVIHPLLASLNLGENARELVARAAQGAASGLPSVLDQRVDVADAIRDALQQPWHEGQWRRFWLDLIPWSLGFHPGEENAIQSFLAELRQAGVRMLTVVDGLEDLFQEVARNEKQQAALRALFQEVPDRLSQEPDRPAGIIVFVRRDMVLAAVRQNAGQLLDRYEPYALKWNRGEALRLVLWTAIRSPGVLPMSESDLVLQALSPATMRDWDALRAEEERALTRLWGRKLGRDRSREAGTAEWVLSALSDFRGQLQARDLMRLLHEAAKHSIDDDQWEDRILSPWAIRAALPVCSQAKIEEIEVENEVLKDLFLRLRGARAAEKQIPFESRDLQLSTDDMRLLENNGVVLRQGDDFYMPEIYRLGLGFTLRGGARPRVLTLTRRAGQGG